MIQQDKYARLFRLFKEREEEPLKRIIAEYERYPDITIRMEDFFEAILKPKCQVQPPLLVVDRLIGECGNFAWHVYTFSVPPRRICFWGMHHDAEDVPCHPRLIKYLELEICQVYNLTPQDLTVLPKSTLPHASTPVFLAIMFNLGSPTSSTLFGFSDGGLAILGRTFRTQTWQGQDQGLSA